MPYEMDAHEAGELQATWLKANARSWLDYMRAGLWRSGQIHTKECEADFASQGPFDALDGSPIRTCNWFNCGYVCWYLEELQDEHLENIFKMFLDERLPFFPPYADEMGTILMQEILRRAARS